MRRTIKATATLSCALALVAASASSAAANTFYVTSTADAVDKNPGDGFCQTDAEGNAPCTLRAAVMEANALAGTDTIQVNTAGVYNLTLSGSDDTAKRRASRD